MKETLPLPNKSIPLAVAIIGTLEVAIGLLGLIILVLAGEFKGYSLTFLILSLVYGALGAGLWAIQEWARRANVILHVVAIPYSLYTGLFLGGQAAEYIFIQIGLAITIIFVLTRPDLRHKFQTVVPKKRHRE